MSNELCSDLYGFLLTESKFWNSKLNSVDNFIFWKFLIDIHRNIFNTSPINRSLVLKLSEQIFHILIFEFEIIAGMKPDDKINESELKNLTCLEITTLVN